MHALASWIYDTSLPYSVFAYLLSLCTILLLHQARRLAAVASIKSTVYMSLQQKDKPTSV